MKKGLFLGFSLMFLAGLVQADGVPGKSLGFGDLQVYIDSADPAPTKREIHYRFLVNDRAAAYNRPGSMIISRIVVFNEGCSDTEEATVESRTPYQTGATLTSPAQTEPIIIEIPKEPTRSNEIACVSRLRFLAFQRKCMQRHVPECRELVVNTQGEFSSEDLKRMEPTDMKELFFKKEEK